MERIPTLVVLAIGAVVLVGGPAMADDERAWVTGEAEALSEVLEIEEVHEFLERLQRELQGGLPLANLREALALFQGRGTFDAGALGRGLVRSAAAELLASTRLLGNLVVLTVLCALLGNLKAALAGHEVGDVAFLVCYLVIVYLATAGFLLASGVARGVVHELVAFMQAILPLMVALLAGMGALTSAGLLHPVLLAGTQLMAMLVADVVIPLVLFSVACDLASTALQGGRLRGLAGLFRQTAVAVMGLGLTAFLGIVAVQGAAGAVADGVSLRTAKFMAGTFIPVIGRIFADAAELVFGSTLLLKSALGVLGMVAVVAMIAYPLTKLVVLVFIYRLAAALAGPFDVPVVADALQQVASGLTLVGLAAGAVGMVSFVALAALVGAGNLTVMLR